jgi:hypothetical protein
MINIFGTRREETLGDDTTGVAMMCAWFQITKNARTDLLYDSAASRAWFVALLHGFVWIRSFLPEAATA